MMVDVLAKVRTPWLLAVSIIVLATRNHAWTQKYSFQRQLRPRCEWSLLSSFDDENSFNQIRRRQDSDSSDPNVAFDGEKSSSARIVQENFDLMLQVMNQNLPSSARPPKLVALKYVGRSVEFPTTKTSQKLVKCMVLQQSSLPSDDAVEANSRQTPQPCLFVPSLDGTEEILDSMRSAALSKTTLRRQNYRVIHRTNGIYDQLPYEWWKTNDSASTLSTNTNLGKRECYNLLLGKDWYLWSIAPKNVTSIAAATDDSSSEAWSDDSAFVLKNRMYLIQLQEYQMKIAECDSEIAYLSVQQNSESADGDSNSELLQYWQGQRRMFVQLLNEIEEQKESQMKEQQASSPITDSVASVKSNNVIASWIQNKFLRQLNRNENPIGMADDSQTSRNVVPYQNTYDMIRRLICQDHLNADVIGILLENTSLLESGLTMGGVIVLRKKVASNEVRIMGETISLSSQTVDKESIYLAECHVDEAIGMSIACDLPVWVESDTWIRGTIMGVLNLASSTEWGPLDPELSILSENQATKDSKTERVLPIRSSRVLSLYGSIISLPPDIGNKDLFPTDNLVRSLSQYDQMSIDDKVRSMFAMSNFQQQSLPRRRVILRNPSILDELLLPFVDESVRFSWNLRDAQRRNDVSRIQELQERQSRLSKAKMNAEMADGNEIAKEYWDNEVEFYSSLRADVTQDEGSYSRYLDRDEWYERDRQRMVQRMLEREKKN